MNNAAHKDLISFVRSVTPGAAKLPFTNLEELRELVKEGSPNSGWKIHSSKWVVSLLKAWYGEAANAGNDYAYHYLPKRDEKKNYSHMQLFEAMHRGEIDGLFVNGTNPVVGGLMPTRNTKP
jgi:formate dehydrogenase major subunit